jgi:hydroxymethylpyrimidine pyrophosphatase-like HAD family hydrolase
MRFRVFATDYDETLARASRVDNSTLAVLERLRASGKLVFMVTGREVDDLRSIFSRLELFDVVVAENGAVLYYPADDKTKPLHAPPPSEFIAQLRARDVSPLSVGQVIVASHEPHEITIQETIKSLGLELEIILNKGAVMVLPPGVNKASGLTAALREKGIEPSRVAGIGDAENDHSFLDLCGLGAAVANALPALKRQADFVTKASHGAGVAELAELIMRIDSQQRRSELELHEFPGVFPGLSLEPGKSP